MPTLDVFTHFMPARFLHAFREHAPNRGMVQRSLHVKPLCDLEDRFRLMDAFQDYRQVISLGSPPIETFADPQLSLELTRLANDGLAELVDRHPSRFAGFLAAVPMNNPDAAADEVHRASHVLGASGVQIYSNVAGEPLDGVQFTAVFDCLDAERLPLFLHPARSERFADYAMEEKSKYEIWWALGWPYETSAAMARLVFSGAFDRWPNLTVVTHHLGGIVPYVAGRIGHGWDQLGKRTSDEDYFSLLRSLKKRPWDYFKMFYADTAQFGSEASTRCGIEFFGADHVLFASDCPYEPVPGIFIRETLQVIRNLGLSEEEREKICFENARRLMPHLRPTLGGWSE
jgi:predicted TIM-barrel fold metal-dependent hydrolase